MKTLEKLVERAKKNGHAKVNGRLYESNGRQSELMEKYSINIENKYIVELKHWGTTTLLMDIEKRKVIEIYGQSKSDRESVNFILSYFGMPFHTHFFPSKEQFELHYYDDTVLKII